MKLLFTTLAVLMAPIIGSAQIKVVPGNYTTADGNYTVTITQNPENTITIIEPMWVSVYKHLGGNEYQYISTKGTDYRLQIIDGKSLKAFKSTTPNFITNYSFSGALISSVSAADAAKYRAIGEKYHKLMTSDSKNAQVYSFCASIAIARGTYNEDGYEVYAWKAILSIKQFLVDVNKCPCEDAIRKDLWDSLSE